MANNNVVNPIAGPQHGIRGEGQLKNITLPPFSGENWFLYSMRVEGELTAAELWDVMSETEARPELCKQNGTGRPMSAEQLFCAHFPTHN